MDSNEWTSITARKIAPDRYRYDGPDSLPPEGEKVEVLLENATQSIGWVTQVSNEYVFTVPAQSRRAVVGWRALP